MLRAKILTSLVGVILSVNAFAGSPVACSESVDRSNFWQIRAWGPMSRLFSDRTAFWVSMSAPAEVRGLPACKSLAGGQKQVLSKVFTNETAGYVGIQALGDGRVTVRIRDSFDYPLYEFSSSPGDFTGALISEVVRLTTGPFSMELENSENGSTSGVIATVVDSVGKVLVHTDASWTGELVGPSK